MGPAKTLKYVEFLKVVYRNFNEDKVLRLASAIAYSSILSIAPLFIVLIAMLGWVLGMQNGGHGHHIAQQTLLDLLSKAIGPGPANSIGQLIDASFNKPRQNIWAQIIGWVGFISGAAGLFSSLQDSLNTIWRIEETHGDWQHIVKTRISSFLMILVVGLLLFGTTMLNTGMDLLGAHLVSWGNLLSNPLTRAVTSTIITFILLTVAFAFVYKVLPDVTILWRDIWLGATLTATLFIIGEAIIGLYLSQVGGSSIYGVAGSLLVALLWIYYSAVIILLGAECTKVMASQAETMVPTTLRTYSEQVAGVDPRLVT